MKQRSLGGSEADNEIPMLAAHSLWAVWEAVQTEGEHHHKKRQ